MVKGREIGTVVGAGGQGKVAVHAFSRTRAGLVDIPPIERILIGRIGVDGNKERLVRIVDDVLGGVPLPWW